MEDRINNMFKIIEAKKKQDVCIGTYCKDTYTGDMMKEWWQNLLDENVIV